MSDIASITDGIFAILVPVSLALLIITLYWAETKAKKLRLVKGTVPAYKATQKKSFLGTVWKYADQIDIIGLMFLGAAVSLILLPLTLSQTAGGGWHNGEFWPCT